MVGELAADDPVAVLSTGSDGDVVRAECASLGAHLPWLALEGLRVIYERNREPSDDGN
jgi:hypothetical protein